MIPLLAGRSNGRCKDSCKKKLGAWPSFSSTKRLRAWRYLRDLRPRNTRRQPANSVRLDIVEAGSISGAATTGQAGTAIAATGATSKTKVKSSLELVFMC
jgi:hypothetical protein